MKIDFVGEWSTCYKLVRNIRERSPRSLSTPVIGNQGRNVLTSVVEHSEQLMVRYKTNRVIEPNVGKLFVFREPPTLGQLNRIVSSMSGHQVYRCQGLNLVDAKCMYPVHSFTETKIKFWENWHEDLIYDRFADFDQQDHNLSGTIHGTCYVDAVRLTKNITQEYR